MTERATRILTEALSLPAAERASMVERLLSSLEPPDPGRDELWAKEAEDRVAAFEAGRIAAIPAETVFAELDSP
jgi:putative addiction module component (TIGR02574 family)